MTNNWLKGCLHFQTTKQNKHSGLGLEKHDSNKQCFTTANKVGLKDPGL